MGSSEECTFLSTPVSSGHVPKGVAIYRWVASQKSTRIPVSLFHSGLGIAGMDVPVEEAECLVANMIYRGFMRGYISHGQQMVVLAANNAFPRIADCPSPYAML